MSVIGGVPTSGIPTAHPSRGPTHRHMICRHQRASYRLLFYKRPWEISHVVCCGSSAARAAEAGGRNHTTERHAGTTQRSHATEPNAATKQWD